MRNATQREPNTIGSFGLELLDKSINSTGCRTRQAFLGRASRSICQGEIGDAYVPTSMPSSMPAEPSSPACVQRGQSCFSPLAGWRRGDGACLRHLSRAPRRRRSTAPATPRPTSSQWRGRQRYSAGRQWQQPARRPRGCRHMDGGLGDDLSMRTSISSAGDVAAEVAAAPMR
jgi:hypothetical protein